MDHGSDLHKVYRKVYCSLSSKFYPHSKLTSKDVESGDNLLLFFQLKEFSKLPDEFLTAKASLLYQKFIKPGAYRYVKFITNDQRERIGRLLEEAMKEDGTPVARSIFDEVMDECETLLIQRVFKGFKSSQFYVEYREAVMLSSNL